MDIVDIIRGRRSIRMYREEPLDGGVVKELIGAAVYAPTGSNAQPWAFAVVENREFLKEWSDLSKKVLLEKAKTDSSPRLQGYKKILENPDFNIFYNAPALVAVYGDPESNNYIQDCSMAALNMMLAAYEKGIGSCWIGFAVAAGNLPEIKGPLNVPENFKIVAPVILGHPDGQWPVMKRKDPVITGWMK
ncbi:MAG: nitroreductase family protein [Bacillota bacterium]